MAAVHRGFDVVVLGPCDQRPVERNFMRRLHWRQLTVDRNSVMSSTPAIRCHSREVEKAPAKSNREATSGFSFLTSAYLPRTSGRRSRASGSTTDKANSPGKWISRGSASTSESPYTVLQKLESPAWNWKCGSSAAKIIFPS